MPWATNAELPDAVRGALPAAAQTRFRQTANDVLAKGGSESSAKARAWVVVKQGWQKGEDGFWVRKVVMDGELLEKAKSRTLYIRRDVKNAKDIITWAKSQGFTTTVPAEDMHVTVCYSKTPVDWMKMGHDHGNTVDSQDLRIYEGGPRLVEPLGDKGAVVLLFASDNLTWRHERLKREGASHDFSGYQPHVTITWDKGGLDLNQVKPYTGEIILGPEIFQEIDENWKDKLVEKSFYEVLLKRVQELGFNEVDVHLAKVDPSLGLVFGWAIVCKRKGEDYYDLNIDPDGERVPEHVPESSMLEAATDFMENSRIAKEMHDGDPQGSVVFAFPMTTEIAKSLGIKTDTTGLLIAMKPGPAMLEKFKKGELTGFSIGGSRVKSRVVNDA